MKIYSRFTKVKEFLKKFEIRPSHFILPTALSLLAALCEGISVATLVPTAKGIITMNFAFVKDSSIFKHAFPYFFQKTNVGNSAIFLLLICIIFFSAILKNIFQYAASLIVSTQVRKLAHKIRNVVFERYLSFGKLFFDRNNSGHLQNILVNFINMVIQQIKGAELALMHLFILAVYLCIMFAISVRLTLIVIIVSPILHYSLKWLTVKLRKTSQYHALSFDELSKKLSNILSCIPLVKLYATEKKEMKEFSAISTQLENLEISIDKKANLIAPLQEVILLVAVLFLISFMSFMAVKERTGEVAAFLVYLYILRMWMRSFNIFYNLKTNLAIAEGPISGISNMLDDKDKFFVQEGPIEFHGLNNNIEFKHMNFQYQSGQAVLNDLSFTIEKNKLTALVGPTGSGKTTIINMILRFYDCPPGTIYVDGTDIREYSLRSLMKRMSLVAQDALLFNDTLRNNIIYGLEAKVPEEKLFEVLKQARLLDFIANLPKGLDTLIGDRGVRLSGGEKQRVAIARALLKDADILIFDEATSSLDTATEKLIQEAIKEVVKERTTVVIAHRLSTIKSAGKIVVIEQGSLVEEGAFAELLDKKNKFYKYWEEQKFF